MNNWATQRVVYGTTFLGTVASAYKTVPGGALIVTGKIRLNTNPGFNPSPGDAIVSNAANEANFSGYTAGGYAVTMTGPVNLSQSIQGMLANCTPTAATATPFVGNTVYGWWLDDGTNVIAAEAFGNGVSAQFGAPGDFLQLEIRLPQSAYQNAA